MRIVWDIELDLVRYKYINPFLLINYRISKAVDLLMHSNLSITDIAFETGFESSNYFTIVFKNKMNSTPRKYRNNKNCSH